jgi:hypothetical protein
MPWAGSLTSIFVNPLTRFLDASPTTPYERMAAFYAIEEIARAEILILPKVLSSSFIEFSFL